MKPAAADNPNGKHAHDAPGDLWIVSAYFNPCGYRSRRENHAAFSAGIRASGLNLVTAECAFGSAPFDLPPGPDVVQVRSPDVLWQKERLLNLALSRVPPGVAKVAWLDGDVLFADPSWARDTSRLLDDHPVVQPFSRVARLGPGQTEAAAGTPLVEGFASVWTRDRGALRRGWFEHGHTGYGWAFRRALLARHGLYDAHIGGIGDHLMAHAMCGDFDGACVSAGFTTSLAETARTRRVGRALRAWARIAPRFAKRWAHRRSAGGGSAGMRRHFLSWARPFHEDVRGRVAAAPGTLLHLWHGEPSDRAYAGLTSMLVERGFDPASDIRIGAEGCWEWASDKPLLRSRVEGYFGGRDEDRT